VSERTALRLWLVSVLLTLVIFGLWPQVDLTVSGWFHDPARGFPLGDLRWVEGMRLALWYAAELLAIVAGIGLAVAMWRPAPGLPARVWGFVLALFVVGPGIAVNGILKEHWGRARPDAVTAFGGDRLFSGPFWPSDQCAHNCSFVSGEAAAAMALGISLYVILRHLRPSPAIRRVGLGVAVAVPVLGAALRVIAGRHFLSDAVCAALIVAGLALLLDRLMLRERP
jgi:lipid A 4'-phosphatase